MSRFTCTLLAAAGLFSAAGCATDHLADYAPFIPGPIPTFGINLPPVFVCDDYDSGADKAADRKESPEQRQAWAYSSIKWDMDETLVRRPAAPGFRQLCDLVNRHFGEWQRLVIIERLGIINHECGFVAIAIADDGPKAVTNLRRDGDLWEDSIYPRVVRTDAGKFRACLAELDRARSVLPPRLLWFGNMDWPIYVLHDVKPDDYSFSFAVCGPFGNGDPKVHPPRPPIDYAKAARQVGKETPPRAIFEGTPRAKELREAGGVYAALIAMVWEASLGPRDLTIFGDFKAPASLAPAEPPKAPVELPPEAPVAEAKVTACGNEGAQRNGR
jgi:hypothetical protein